MGAAARVIPSLLATDTDTPLEVTAVASDPSSVDRIAALPRSASQRVRVIPPQPDLAALTTDMDLVISASGSTVWELLAIGVPTAVVCVVDNQRMGYQAVLDAGIATGLGFLQAYDAAGATHILRDLIETPSRVAELAIRGQQLIDGRGRSRVADELLRAMAGRPVIPR
jgi:spore coat polysaccharide biosynthesis predicted glycosyltransferase SpsG